MISSLYRFESDESIFRVIQIRILSFLEYFVFFKKFMELLFPAGKLIIHYVYFFLVNIFHSLNSLISYLLTSFSCFLSSFIKSFRDSRISLCFKQVFGVVQKFNFLKDIFDFNQVIMPIIVVKRQSYFNYFCQCLCTISCRFTFQVFSNHFFEMHPNAFLDCELILLLRYVLSFKCFLHQHCIWKVTCHQGIVTQFN